MKYFACFLLAVAMFFSPAAAQFRGRGGPMQPAGPGMVNLPYIAADNNGMQWRIYQSGWLQQQGNIPVYSQGAMITINGNQPAQANNQAKVEEKTGELIFENMNASGIAVTRRILINKDEGYVRYIDILKNPTGQDQQVAVMIQTNLNFGVNASTMVADPKIKDHNLGWVAQTGAGAAAVEVYGGKRAKMVPTLNSPQGNNLMQASLTLAIPAKEAALMHLHSTAANQEAGQAFVEKLNERAIFKSISPAIRRLIVNFAAGQNMVGDVEVLRGDLLDVVELRSGDQLRGTLKETGFDLQTAFGPVTLPIDKVAGLVNVGQFRPHQLLITSDGQVFGGALKKQTIDLQLGSGQITQVPLSQVTRMGYRKRADESDEWNFEGKAMVFLRSGERVGVQLPTAPVQVVTRYGRLALDSRTIAFVLLQNEENGVHDIHLTDGSHFAGLLAADGFDMKLSTAGQQDAKFPIGEISRLQLAGKVNEPDDFAPTLHLNNDDLLVGVVTGQLKLDTAFDTITVAASEVKELTHANKNPSEVQLTLWDGSTLSGELHDQELTCQLTGGVTMKVSVGLVESYSQPQPQPSVTMMEKIKGLLKDLNGEDWKQRDRAQAALTKLGPVAIGTLRQMRADQPPEAQKAIDTILVELEKQRGSSSSRPGAGNGQPAPQINGPED